MTATIQTTHACSAEQWSDQVFNEYLGQNPFFSFMGADSNQIVQTKEELTKAAGDAITVQLRAKLTGAGVTGATTLKGNEEDLIFYGQKISVDTVRHAVILNGEMSEQRVAFDLRMCLWVAKRKFWLPTTWVSFICAQQTAIAGAKCTAV